MSIRSVASAFAAGVAAFLLTFVSVAELLLPYVEFSVLVAIPVGLAVGAAVGAFVLSRLGRGNDPVQSALAAGLAGFGGVLLVTFAALALVGQGATLSLVVATVVGLLGGAAVFVRRRDGNPRK